MAGMVCFMLMIILTREVNVKFKARAEAEASLEYWDAVGETLRKERRYGAIMSRLPNYSGDYIAKHSPPAMNTIIGVALAKQFVSNMKHDLALKENYEVVSILRAWNKIYGSPFTEDQLKEFALTEPVKRTPRPKKGTTPTDQPHLPFTEENK
jgi:hypothetical protein